MLSLNCEYVHNVSSYYKALLNRFNSDKSGTFSSNNCYLTTTIIIVFSSPGKINAKRSAFLCFESYVSREVQLDNLRRQRIYQGLFTRSFAAGLSKPNHVWTW